MTHYVAPAVPNQHVCRPCESRLAVAHHNCDMRSPISAPRSWWTPVKTRVIQDFHDIDDEKTHATYHAHGISGPDVMTHVTESHLMEAGHYIAHTTVA